MRTYFIGVLLGIGVLFCACNSSKTSGASEQKVLEGKLVKKPWTKSMESYCAGGSDYWVMELKSGEHVILKAQKAEGEEGWTDLDGRKVNANGVFRLIERPTAEASSEGEISQRPVSQAPASLGGEESASVECRYFEVSSMAPVE